MTSIPSKKEKLMKIVTRNEKIIEIDNFDVIQRDDNAIYAIKKRNDNNIRVLLCRYDTEDQAKDVFMDLADQIRQFKM